MKIFINYRFDRPEIRQSSCRTGMWPSVLFGVGIACFCASIILFCVSIGLFIDSSRCASTARPQNTPAPAPAAQVQSHKPPLLPVKEQNSPVPPQVQEKLSLVDTLQLVPKLSGFKHFGENRSHTVYAFFDPDCSGCEKAMRDVSALDAEFRAADADIQWIPVTILGTDRTKAGRALLSGKPGKGEANSQALPEAAILDKIDVNTAALVYALERPAVPYFVWGHNGESSAYIGTPSHTHWKMILDSWKEEQ